MRDPVNFLNSDQKISQVFERPVAKTRRTFVVPAVAGALVVLIFIVTAASTHNAVSSWAGDALSRFTRFITGAADRPGSDDPYLNVLVMGIGGEGHDGGQLADTIMLLSYQKEQKKLALVSIPRDLVVPTPQFGPQKINAVHAYAQARKAGTGGDAMSQTVGDLLGVPIDYYITFDFSGFEKIVDELGGVRVCVDTAFSDTQYPDKNFGYTPISFESGCQTMNGARALAFARSRHGTAGEGSDFARSRRQQKVLLAVKDALLNSGVIVNPFRLNVIARELGAHVSTSASAQEIAGFLPLASALSSDRVVNKVFDTTPGSGLVDSQANGAYTIVPAGGDYSIFKTSFLVLFNTDAPGGSAIVQAGEDEKPAVPAPATPEKPTQPEGAKSVKVLVLNGSFVSGLASATANDLTALGYTVVKFGNAPVRNFETTTIYSVGKSPQAAHLTFLLDHFSARIGTDSPAWIQGIGIDADYVIVMGGAGAASSAFLLQSHQAAG